MADLPELLDARQVAAALRCTPNATPDPRWRELRDAFAIDHVPHCGRHTPEHQAGVALMVERGYRTHGFASAVREIVMEPACMPRRRAVPDAWLVNVDEWLLEVVEVNCHSHASAKKWGPWWAALDDEGWILRVRQIDRHGVESWPFTAGELMRESHYGRR